MRRCSLVLGLVATTACLAAPAAQATFPGANGKITFTRFVEGGYQCVYTMNADGSGQAQVGSCEGGDKESAWSPDGKRLAYESGAHNGAIVTANPDGSDVSVVYDTGVGTRGLGWSPDGQRLVGTYNTMFEYPGSGESELFTVALDGSGYRSLVKTATLRDPDWSPDGRKIAFTDPHQTKEFMPLTYADIHTVNPDGTGLTLLTADIPYHGDASSSWSPDGSRIAFSSNRDDPEGRNEEIYLMNRDGSDPRRLTFDSARDLDPAWSPDGEWIVWVRGTGDWPYAPPTELYAMRKDGSEVTRLTDLGIYHPHDPDWQPIPSDPPSCSGVAATPRVLDQARGGLRLVNLSGAVDANGDHVTITVEAVTQDEPLTGQGDRTSPDALSTLLSATPPPAATQLNEVYLRAERRNNGDGRVYRIAFSAHDGKGGRCSGTTSVTVPRRAGVAALDSAPPSYDSVAG
jgi:TolB protein